MAVENASVLMPSRLRAWRCLFCARGEMCAGGGGTITGDETLVSAVGGTQFVGDGQPVTQIQDVLERTFPDTKSTLGALSDACLASQATAMGIDGNHSTSEDGVHLQIRARDPCHAPMPAPGRHTDPWSGYAT